MRRHCEWPDFGALFWFLNSLNKKDQSGHTETRKKREKLWWKWSKRKKWDWGRQLSDAVTTTGSFFFFFVLLDAIHSSLPSLLNAVHPWIVIAAVWLTRQENCPGSKNIVEFTTIGLVQTVGEYFWSGIRRKSNFAAFSRQKSNASTDSWTLCSDPTSICKQTEEKEEGGKDEEALYLNWSKTSDYEKLPILV